ncbi:MAG: rod shape-determining protein RodA [Actinomycetes bacterium]
MDMGYFGADRADRLRRESVQDKWQDAYAPVRHLDPVLVITAVLLSVLGIVVIYSAKVHQLELQGLPTGLFATRQLIALVVGLIAMAAVAVFDYRYLRAYAAVLYAGSLVMLALVLTPLGVEVNGAQAWLAFGGFQFQPSEITKVAVIVAIAALLHERREDPGLVSVLLSLAILAPPLGLIMLQPDPGTASVFLFTAFVLLLVAGIQFRWLGALAGLGVAGLVAVIQAGLLKEHQVARLTAFLDTENSAYAQTIRYNSDQSLIAIGSGQFFGKGLFQGTQTNLSYVPENHTDFIFTVVGEEFGFVGAIAVLGLIAVLLWRGLRIAMLAKDRFGMLVAAGAVGMIVFQVFVNVGMTVGIMPVIGIPLPFVSYGGTSLIASFILVGLLLNVHMRRF